ncbi:MAG TPA: tetratricopeptide repeat protein [Thermoplasmata archaeon]|nr:tetratricopeptide repeat protein [Thermoplasmata archaeon]
MASAPFVELSGAIVQAMGQRLDALKPTAEGVLLRTGDGFLFAFLEDPSRISLADIGRLIGSDRNLPQHLVVLSPGHLPLALAEEVVRGGGTLVEGARFAELVRQLGLETMLGEGPRPSGPEARRLLPSAQHLDAVMHRARTWLDWGVPALALRFYRQASELKPGFLPARIGIGRALLALGLVDDAERTFDDVLVLRPSDVEAKLGRASVLGARARPKDEIAIYRALLAEDEARTEVRAHLVAALVDLGDWASALVELDAMLRRTPEDPSLRFLRSVALERTGRGAEGRKERREARKLGLPYDREVALSKHLGIEPPPPPAPEEAVAPEAPARPARRAPTRPARAAAKRPPPAPKKAVRPATPRKRK